jgi:hypothetical protein
MALSMIDCARILFPIEISAKILYLAGAMDLGVNARKYLQVNPRKIEELESTYSKLYKICKKRSDLISVNSRYDFISKKKRLRFDIYISHDEDDDGEAEYNLSKMCQDDDGTEPFTRCYRFICLGREEVIRHTL